MEQELLKGEKRLAVKVHKLQQLIETKQNEQNANQLGYTTLFLDTMTPTKYKSRRMPEGGADSDDEDEADLFNIEKHLVKERTSPRYISPWGRRTIIAVESPDDDGDDGSYTIHYKDSKNSLLHAIAATNNPELIN